MPRYLDRHPVPTGVLPAQVLQGQVMLRVKADILSGKPDRFRVVPINVFVSAHEIVCLTEAPDLEALIGCHEARGIHLQHGDIAQVLTLL